MVRDMNHTTQQVAEAIGVTPKVIEHWATRHNLAKRIKGISGGGKGNPFLFNNEALDRCNIIQRFSAIGVHSCIAIDIGAEAIYTDGRLEGNIRMSVPQV